MDGQTSRLEGRGPGRRRREGRLGSGRSRARRAARRRQTPGRRHQVDDRPRQRLPRAAERRDGRRAAHAKEGLRRGEPEDHRAAEGHEHRRRLCHPGARRRARPDLRRRRPGSHAGTGRRPGDRRPARRQDRRRQRPTRSPATTPTVPSTRRSAPAASCPRPSTPTPAPRDAMDLALQPNGRIIVVGVADDGGLEDENIGMQRYDGNGDLDIGFGDQGIVSTDFGGTRHCAYGVAVQDDSKIVVVGEANGVDVAVARYDTAGLPDPSFSGPAALATSSPMSAARSTSPPTSSSTPTQRRGRRPRLGRQLPGKLRHPAVHASRHGGHHLRRHRLHRHHSRQRRRHRHRCRRTHRRRRECPESGFSTGKRDVAL